MTVVGGVLAGTVVVSEDVISFVVDWGAVVDVSVVIAEVSKRS